MQKLSDIKGLSEAKIDKMLEAAKKLCPQQYGWLSAREFEALVSHPCSQLLSLPNSSGHVITGPP